MLSFMKRLASLPTTVPLLVARSAAFRMRGS
jgi:hypothetical protein